MNLKIKVGRKALNASLVDNQTARDFGALLPLTITMDDLFGREKFGKLPRALSTTAPRQHRYEVGDVGYWSPARDVAIYYRQDDQSIPSPGIILIGKIGAGTEALNVPGSVRVTIERA
jgi:hypothetical protein